ncbi:Uncharacterised protein [uncultured archaeon]|nr:Uncharacterised protein [uncultured archaeon]
MKTPRRIKTVPGEGLSAGEYSRYADACNSLSLVDDVISNTLNL